jgi:hypothetical protein
VAVFRQEKFRGRAWIGTHMAVISSRLRYNSIPSRRREKKTKIPIKIRFHSDGYLQNLLSICLAPSPIPEPSLVNSTSSLVVTHSRARHKREEESKNAAKLLLLAKRVWKIKLASLLQACQMPLRAFLFLSLLACSSFILQWIFPFYGSPSHSHSTTRSLISFLLAFLSSEDERRAGWAVRRRMCRIVTRLYFSIHPSLKLNYMEVLQDVHSSQSPE